jgi:general secretion pathway protein G
MGETMRNLGLLFLSVSLTVTSSACDSGKAKASKVQNDLKLLAQGLTQYEVDFNRFPSKLDALRSTTVGGDGHQFGPYVVSLPVDPWGNAYIYHGPVPEDGLPVLLSTGADGREGGSDDVHQPIKSIRSK